MNECIEKFAIIALQCIINNNIIYEHFAMYKYVIYFLTK